MYKKVLLFIFLISMFSLSFVSAWEFNGTVRDVNGNPLFNATVNVTVRDNTFSVVGYNATVSNQTGWYNLSVTDSSDWFYEPNVQHFKDNATDGSTAIDFVGQSVPAFSFFELQNGLKVDFYLREAGTINISAVNATGGTINFLYIIKDQKLGYPISEDFTNYVSFKTIFVPRDRNYSVMLFPNESMPVSFDWNNFSATADYTITAGLSDYNVTTHTLNKTFNITENLPRVTGYIADELGAISGWDEFAIVPFILEPGNMVFLGDNAAMPFNMSAWTTPNATSDVFNLTSGFYNITLPGPAESANYMLFATARNSTSYYGGYRNMSLNFSSSGTEINFTMWPLMGPVWGDANSNFTMNDATDWSQLNVSTAKQGFNLVNSTGLLSELSSHIEVTVDYSDYNATEFTFMLDTAQSGSASFYVPLINSTGIKEMNIYSANYAPKRVGTKTAAEIIANNNITLKTFDPGDIDSLIADSNIVMELYTSNSTCDVPNPGASCILGSSTNLDDHDPLGALIGGGKISFRMGTGGILVHYVNVDMLASGPPDALFDSSTSETTTDGFDSALRFGSLGPTIYDFVLVSIPYIEGSTSTTGLDESAEVNISIPLFFDENVSGVIDWDKPIWNITANGTSGSALSGNHSHFSTFSSEWQTLMGNTTCTTNVSNFNSTNPCFIDTANDRIWIRLPHFSGTKPSVSGGVITKLSDDADGGGGGGGGGGSSITQPVEKVHSFTKITPGVVTIIKDFDVEIGVKQIQIEVNSEAQDVKITVTKYDGKPVAVSVEKSGKVYKYLQIEATNLADKLSKATVTIQVVKSWLSSNGLAADNVALFRFDESVGQWNELATTYVGSEGDNELYDIELTSFSFFAISEKSAVVEEGAEGVGEGGANLTFLWIIIGVVALVLIGWGIKKGKE